MLSVSGSRPGPEKDFLDVHKNVGRDWPGLRHANIIKTGDHTYCIIAEWTDVEVLCPGPAEDGRHPDAFRTCSRISAAVSA